MMRMLRLGLLAAMALAATIVGSSGRSFEARAADDPTELGEGKEEFETGSQGGTYRFEYVAEGEDGYRVVFWRQSNPLSDDNKDANLAESVIKAVFLNRFCKELNKPVALADGSPAPTGKIGIWTATLRCAEPPPKAKKAAAEKAKKAKEEIVVDKPKADGSPSEAKAKSEGDGGSGDSAASGSSDAPAKPAKKPAAAAEYDGPMECTRTDDGYACRPVKR